MFLDLYVQVAYPVSTRSGTSHTSDWRVGPRAGQEVAFRTQEWPAMVSGAGSGVDAMVLALAQEAAVRAARTPVQTSTAPEYESGVPGGTCLPERRRRPARIHLLQLQPRTEVKDSKLISTGQG